MNGHIQRQLDDYKSTIHRKWIVMRLSSWCYANLICIDIFFDLYSTEALNAVYSKSVRQKNTQEYNEWHVSMPTKFVVYNLFDSLCEMIFILGAPPTSSYLSLCTKRQALYGTLTHLVTCCTYRKLNHLLKCRWQEGILRFCTSLLFHRMHVHFSFHFFLPSENPIKS